MFHNDYSLCWIYINIVMRCPINGFPNCQLKPNPDLSG